MSAPVTFPIELSAVASSLAAFIDANVSGSEVPSATKVMAVREFSREISQPNCVATSPISTTCNRGNMSGHEKTRENLPGPTGHMIPQIPQSAPTSDEQQERT